MTIERIDHHWASDKGEFVADPEAVVSGMDTGSQLSRQAIVIVGCPPGRMAELHAELLAHRIDVRFIHTIEELHHTHHESVRMNLDENLFFAQIHPNQVFEGQTVGMEFMADITRRTRLDLEAFAASLAALKIEYSVSSPYPAPAPKPRKRRKRGHNSARDRIIT